MCSINGFNFENRDLMKQMLKSQVHRGPDDNGIFSDSELTLGHMRLSILDLSKSGRQPMELDGMQIVFNGEIYNFKELRESLEAKGHSFNTNTDTEVLLHMYKEYGQPFVKQLNGMFALCIYDGEKLFLARDRMGIKPLYYYYDSETFIFSSEIKAILQHPIKRIINEPAMDNFLAFRYNRLNDTLFQHIYKLPPGHAATYSLKNKTFVKYSYWSVNQFSTVEMPLQVIERQLDNLLQDSVKKRMISDVPVGVYLSGGIDSTAITAYASALNPNINTFSITTNDSRFHDSKFARLAAEHYNTNHTEIPIDVNDVSCLPEIIYHLDEPLADPASLPLYLMSKKVRPKAIVVLNGSGGDELFGGYSHYPLLIQRNNLHPHLAKFSSSVIKHIPASFAKSVSSYFSGYGEKGKERLLSLLNAKSKEEMYLSMVQIMNQEERLELLKQPSSIPDNFKSLFSTKEKFMKQIAKVEMQNFLVENILMVADKTTMASSLEARVPFLDHRLVELSLRMDPSLWIKRFQKKWILKKVLSSKIPKPILARKKQGFYMPIDKWLGNELKDLSYDTILTCAKEVGWDTNPINKMYNNYSSSPLYYARQMWSLYNFAIWKKKFNLEMSLRS